ncbi:MAG: carboxy-S-adenosyl-L-methionine synthase CmoA [Bacteroidetes bacterium]|nr:carboxy-S-adenosyl-L-methionine synthase CmoA [Bacteroidota bacterium]
MTKKTDKIFSTPLNKIVDFKFDEKTANVFADMINRSIPGYSSIISIVGMLAAKYAQPKSNLYDLGTSLGASALSMRRSLKDTSCKIIAVDNSLPMINRAKDFIKNDVSDIPVKLICEDIIDTKIRNASVVVLNYTLQFVKRENRDILIGRIYKGLLPGGILILSEKIKFKDEETNKRQIELYHSFKKLNGYSDLEISQKRNALEKVLIPETIDDHKNRILKAGFITCDIWFQSFNFISIIARK